MRAPITPFENFRDVFAPFGSRFFDAFRDEEDFMDLMGEIGEAISKKDFSSVSFRGIDKRKVAISAKNYFTYRHRQSRTTMRCIDDLIVNLEDEKNQGRDSVAYDAQSFIALEGAHDIDIRVFWEFWRSGRKMFSISDGLLDELMETECLKVRMGDAAFPFDCFCVQLPRPILSHFQVDCIYVQLAPGRMRVLFGVEGITALSVSMEATQEDTIEDIIRKNPHIHSPAILTAINLVIAICLYMASEDADIEDERPATVFHRKRDSALPYCRLGASIPVSSGRSTGSGTGGSHTIKVLKYSVRGHFRNQACGPGHSQRKIIWIRPMLKGRERHSDIQQKPTEYKVT